jgi:oligoribonuclease (3'-5' exoribonuclease)
MKYVSIDIETTGLEIGNAQVLSVGLVVDDLEEQLPIEELPRLHLMVDTTGCPIYVGTLYAFVLNSDLLARTLRLQQGEENLESHELFVEHGKVGITLRHWLELHVDPDKKVVFAGKNAGSFDLPFLCHDFNLDDYISYSHKVLDPTMLYMKASDETPPSLDQCLERAGIEEEVTHNALDDALAVVKLIRHHFFGRVIKRGKEQGFDVCPPKIKSA